MADNSENLHEDRDDLAEGTREAHRALGVSGIWSSAGEPVVLSDDYRNYPGGVTEALAWMQLAGIEGPYGIALGNRCWQGLLGTVNEGGYPILNVIRNLLDGPIVWAPAVDGAGVLSLRGGDFRLTV